METLPQDIIIHIMGFLQPSDIYRWKNVNHYYNSLFKLETIKLADWFHIEDVNYRHNHETFIDKEEVGTLNTYSYPYLDPIAEFHVYIWLRELIELDTMILSFPLIHCWSYKHMKPIRTVEELRDFIINKQLKNKTIRLVTKALGNKLLHDLDREATRGRVKTYS